MSGRVAPRAVDGRVGSGAAADRRVRRRWIGLCVAGAALGLEPAGPVRAPALVGQETAPDTVYRLRELVVSASRTETEVRDVPVHVTVIGREQLRLSAAQTLQDVLLEVPGVNFRLQVPAGVAHPSWQAVTIRGLGGTAASRTLVLVDGVPLNDPYFGWVRWSQVPIEAIERIEIVRGGATVSWGGQSLAGVIHVITRRPERGGLSAGAEGGSFSTFRGDALGSFATSSVQGYVAGELFDSDGYILTREDLRGRIDVPSASDHAMLRGRVSIDAAPGLVLHAQGSYFDEDKVNATPLRRNSTRAGFGQIGATLDTEDGSKWSAAAFFQTQTYANSFSAEDPTRDSEEPSLDQFDVPSSGIGASLQYTREGPGAHTLNAGVDILRASGEAFEDFLWVGGTFRNRRHTGGDQVLAGVFLHDRIAIDERWQVEAGLRLDWWRNLDGFRRISTVTGGQRNIVVDSVFEGRTEARLSHSIGLRHRASDEVSLRGSFYSGLRVATLNELYKPFRAAGGVVTEANADLDPERVLGAEVGVDYQPDASWLLRLTGFWARVSDAILDATIATVDEAGVVPPCGFVPAGGACRQRQNLGAIRSLGVETELEWRPAGAWLFAASYELNPTEIVEAPGRPEVVGNRSLGSPVHRATLRAGHADPATLEAIVTGRFTGSRFDDDLNQFEIDESFVVDLRLRRRVTPRLTAFASFQNLFDTEFEISEDDDGFVRVGPPRAFTGGLRLRIGG